MLGGLVDEFYEPRLLYKGGLLPEGFVSSDGGAVPDTLISNYAYTDAGVRKVKDVEGGNDAILNSGHGLAGDGTTQYLPIALNTFIAQRIYFRLDTGALVVEEVNAVVATDNFLQGTTQPRNNLIYTNTTLTASELNYLEQNPEKFLFMDSGAVKSGYVDASKIVAWYPLCEKVSDVRGLSNFAVNLASPVVDFTNDIVQGYTNPDIHTITFDELTKTANITLAGVGNVNFLPEIRIKSIGADLTKKYAVKLTIVSDGDFVAHSLIKLAAGFGTVIGSGTTIVQGIRDVTTADEIVKFSIQGNNALNTAVNITCKFEVTQLTASSIVNYTSVMRSNAEATTSGYQSLLVTKDGFGVPTGLAKPFELEGDGAGYIALSNTLDNTTDWELDLLVRSIASDGTTRKYFGNDTDLISIKTSAVLGSHDIVCLVGNKTQTITNASQIDSVITMRYEQATATVSFYQDAIQVGVSQTGSTFIGSSAMTLLGAIDADVGSWQAFLTLRTDSQRLADTNLIKIRHGIIL